MRPEVEARGAKRSVDRNTLAGLLPLLAILPVWLVALLPFWAPVQMVFDVSFTAFAVAHLATSLLLFARPLQVSVVGRLLGARRPDTSESARIDVAWRSVLQANGLERSRFELMILPSDDLNAFACGGHLVVVTSFAVDSLPRNELSGVLAHELAHHLGLHTAALTITQWLSVPVWLLARLGFFLDNVATAAIRSFASHSAALTALGGILATAIRVVSWVFLSGLWVSNAVGNVVGKRAEFSADRRVIDMGFGRPLASALRRVAQATGHSRLSWWNRLAASHPSALLRVAKIEAAIRAQT